MERRELMEHQKEMVSYSLNQKHDGWLVEMRLGKTLADVREVQARNEPYPQLVIAPGNVMNAWEKELDLEGEAFIRGYSLTKQKRIDAVNYVFNADKRTWLLINYEALNTIPGIVDLKWGKVRLDESPKIKDPKTKTSHLIASGFANTRYRGIRSGLIAPEHELDIFQQMKFMFGSFLNCKSYWTFRNKYFEHQGYDWVPAKGVRSVIKNIIHERCFVLTRKQANLDKKKIHETRFVEMNSTQRKLYKQIESDFEYQLDSHIKMLDEFGEEVPEYFAETIWATERAIWLARIAGGFTPGCEEVISTAKIDDLIGLLRGDLKGESVVVWYRFLEELYHDQKYLEERGFKVAIQAGKLKLPNGKYKLMLPKDRFAEEIRFNNGEAQILLCMHKLSAQGKDFSKASVAYYRSEEYSCDISVQSEDRILHPMKPDNGLLYIHSLCKDTVDEQARSVIGNKIFNAKDFVTSFRDEYHRIKSGQFLLPEFEEFLKETSELQYYEKVL